MENLPPFGDMYSKLSYYCSLFLLRVMNGIVHVCLLDGNSKELECINGIVVLFISLISQTLIYTCTLRTISMLKKVVFQCRSVFTLLKGAVLQMQK